MKTNSSAAQFLKSVSSTRQADLTAPSFKRPLALSVRSSSALSTFGTGSKLQEFTSFIER